MKIDFNRCERCGKRNPICLTMSRFNTQMICNACNEKEIKHPKYEEARKAELEAVKKGNYNFVGIGKPEDL